MLDFKSMNLAELTETMENMGEKKFRAKQVFEWLHVHKAASYEEMKNLPKSLKQKMMDEGTITILEKEDLQISREDGTRKYLYKLEDGNMVESVLMRYSFGNSVCISSQVGCRMGCRFCASTLDGLLRSLTPAEMLDQIYRIERDIDERVNHVVVMGT